MITEVLLLNFHEALMRYRTLILQPSIPTLPDALVGVTHSAVRTQFRNKQKTELRCRTWGLGFGYMEP